MNKYFTKVNFPVILDSYQIIGLQKAFVNTINGVDYGVKYFDVTTETNFWSILPPEYHSDFYGRFMHVNSFLPPHIDDKDLTAILFYFSPDEFRTQYYDILDPNHSYQRPDQEKGLVFNHSGLIATDSFIAQPNDVYIINGSEVHEVMPVDYSAAKKFDRKAIRLSTSKYSYQEVVNMVDNHLSNK